ncbi:MAG: N-acetyltransferase [Rhodobacteraceae bacterium]|nr:N-acetyltransferase [Paracoccaceae bacterium]
MTQISLERDQITIRPVEPADESSVHELLVAAFGQETEADLVHKLHHCGAFIVELVATTSRGRLLGHIGFSRVTASDTGDCQGLLISCLAPLAVWPEFQHEGIGSLLVEKGISMLREAGEDLVLVLGPPSYYPRFGFDAELAKKVNAPYAGNAFMALALSPAGEDDLPVDVSFATPFQEL